MWDAQFDVAALLQQLIRFDTTNPPGNEAAVITFVDDILRKAGIETIIRAKVDNRPNLIARITGRGEAPPLMMYGHVDVVTTVGQQWAVPPFSGEIIDGFLWGRGALDMKGGVAMMITAFLLVALGDEKPPGDILLVLLSDEEADGVFGAKFMVEEHAELFQDIRYAIGEGGGPSVSISGSKFYPIMVNEKRVCSVRVTTTGPGGHGSMPIRGGAMAKMSRVLAALDQKRLPVHITQVAKDMLSVVADNLPGVQGMAFQQILNPTFTGSILDVLGENGRLIDPLLHNTVSPTIIRGGHKINVICSEVTLDLDGRLLPGYEPEDMLRELRGILGDEVGLELLRFDPGPETVDKAFYDHFAGLLKMADPQGIPMPYLLSGVTDGRHFARLGIQTIGFLPMDLPAGLLDTIHNADERVPVQTLDFGTSVLYAALIGFNAIND